MFLNLFSNAFDFTAHKALYMLNHTFTLNNLFLYGKSILFYRIDLHSIWLYNGSGFTKIVITAYFKFFDTKTEIQWSFNFPNFRT